jgi:carbon monoxide dehydrogenase subunit G
VRREREIAASADDVWARITDAAGLAGWFPGIESSTVDGDTRVITMGSGIPLAETILTNDSIQRRFQYRIAGGLFKEHLGTIDVIPTAAERCLVVYSSDADPATMAIVLGGATGNALDELARQLESGSTQKGS